MGGIKTLAVGQLFRVKRNDDEFRVFGYKREAE